MRVPPDSYPEPKLLPAGQTVTAVSTRKDSGKSTCPVINRILFHANSFVEQTAAFSPGTDCLGLWGENGGLFNCKIYMV
jgi:hypothetical protein